MISSPSSRGCYQSDVGDGSIFSLERREVITTLFYLVRHLVLDILGIAEGFITCFNRDSQTDWRQQFQPFLDQCEALFLHYQDFPIVILEDERNFDIDIFNSMRGVVLKFDLLEVMQELSNASEEEWKPWISTIDGTVLRRSGGVTALAE